MSNLPRRSASETSAPGGPPSLASEPDDVLEIARRRMRHLAPWRVEPMPMHRAGAAAQAVKSSGEERTRRLALQVLALQMAQASSKGALT
jgi:hypothetical protein